MVVGSVELEPLTDAVGVLASFEELYPETPAEAWEPYRELYPGLFAPDGWRVPCTYYLFRFGAATLLVDTGVGPRASGTGVPSGKATSCRVSPATACFPSKSMSS